LAFEGAEKFVKIYITFLFTLHSWLSYHHPMGQYFPTQSFYHYSVIAVKCILKAYIKA